MEIERFVGETVCRVRIVMAFQKLPAFTATR
jgi:hypothetical protein